MLLVFMDFGDVSGVSLATAYWSALVEARGAAGKKSGRSLAWGYGAVERAAHAQTVW